MNINNLRIIRNVAWGLAAVTMFLLVLGDKKNNLLNALTFVLIVIGIVFALLLDKKIQKNHKK